MAVKAKAKVKREKSTDSRRHYVTNAVLLPEVKRAKELGYVTNELAVMIRMIAERYSRSGSYVNYSFREDMVAAATLNLCNNALKFDTEKYSNPFAYYTTAVYHSFLQFIAEEKKHREIRDKLLIDAGSNPSFAYSEKDEQSIIDSDMAFEEVEETVEMPEEQEEKPVKKPETDEEFLENLIEGNEDESEAHARISNDLLAKKQVRYRFQNREPSQMTVMKGSQMEFDEELGYYVPKKD